jgi:hypothetical protein
MIASDSLTESKVTLGAVVNHLSPDLQGRRGTTDSLNALQGCHGAMSDIYRPKKCSGLVLTELFEMV